jgi:acetyl-CoA acetyltransferase
MSTATQPAGQRALYQVGMSRHPHHQRQQQLLDRLDRLFMARQAIESGALDCVLALGFEQMKPARSAPSSPTGRARSTSSTPRRQLVDRAGRPAGAALFRRRRASAT